MAERQQWAETGVGVLVLGAAGAFLVYALSHVGGMHGRSGYELIARFGQVGSLAPGADVRVAGVKVGEVTGIDLDPKTFLARTRMELRPDVHLPSDSSVKITSDSLLGGQHVAIEPGGAADDLKPGQEFQNVQGAVDLFGLIGQVIRPQGGGTSSTTSGAAPAASGAGAAAPAAPAGKSADPYPGG